MTLHLACTFQAIKLPNERVIARFNHSSLQFLYIAEMSYTPQLQDPLSRVFHEYWQLLICIQVDLGYVYKLTTSKRSDKQWLWFK